MDDKENNQPEVSEETAIDNNHPAEAGEVKEPVDSLELTREQTRNQIFLANLEAEFPQNAQNLQKLKRRMEANEIDRELFNLMSWVNHYGEGALTKKRPRQTSGRTPLRRFLADRNHYHPPAERKRSRSGQ